mgnify:CR=1 FL=1
MEKLNEILLGGMAVVGGFLTRRIYQNYDALDKRISYLERTVVKKNDLEPIERTTDMILTHILNEKK